MTKDCDCELVEGCRKCLGLDTKWKGESELAPIYDAIILWANMVKAIEEFNKKWGYP